MGNCSSAEMQKMEEEAKPEAQPVIKPEEITPETPVVWNPPPWDKELMTQGLKQMESTLELAETGPLAEMPPFPPPKPTQFEKPMLEWDFDVFSVPYEELPALAYHAISTHSSIKNESRIDLPKLWRFINEIYARYHRRPFHNFRHATDVLLGCSTLLRLVEQDHPNPFQDQLSVAALLISALVHDTDHPGVMNGFLVAINHPIAVRLDKPVAVLENHHSAVALALLRREELNFLSNLDPAEQEHVFDLIKENVLNTDVTTTMPKAKEFEQGKAKRRMSASVADFERRASTDDTSMNSKDVICMIIKSADISNPARQLAVYRKWIEGVMMEFFTQGDYERAEQMPFSMNCDRETVVLAKAQIGFIMFLVAPLFKALAAYAPSVKPLVEQIEKNKAFFDEMAAAEAAAAEAKEPSS